MREEKKKQLLKEFPEMYKKFRHEKKQLDKFIKREFGTIRRKLYAKATSADVTRHINFQIKQRNEFFKDRFKTRLENLAVRHKKN